MAGRRRGEEVEEEQEQGVVNTHLYGSCCGCELRSDEPAAASLGFTLFIFESLTITAEETSVFMMPAAVLFPAATREQESSFCKAS